MRCAALIVVGVALCFGAGCGKKPAQTQVDAAMKQPGAVEVMAAINKKDYDGAVATLVKIQQGATNEQQQVQFLVIMREAKMKLNEVALSDPKATDALTALRFMSSGR